MLVAFSGYSISYKLTAKSWLMFLTILDLVLVFLIFLAVAFGFITGLIQAVGGFIGLALGAWAAGRFYDGVGVWLTPVFLGNSITAHIVAFILIFTVVNRLVGLVFWLVGKIFNLVSIIPFTKTINRLLGALFGLAEGVLGLGLSLYFINQVAFASWFHDVITVSKVAQWLIWASGILVPLLPEIVRRVQTVL